MKKYQITEIAGDENHAGTKATADCAVIAEKLGFIQLPLRMSTTESGYMAKAKRQIAYFKEWKVIYNTIEPKSIVLLQEPFHYPQLTREKTLLKLKTDKKAKFISIVHDVEELRKFRFNDYYREEFKFMLELADVLIVHNEKMKQYFIEKGVSESRLVSLEIFDYLQSKPNLQMPAFVPSITVAGNLDVTKCGYIGELANIGVEVNLYGPNFEESMNRFSNIHYKGSFPSDIIPSKLTEGFGLVWDGNTIHGCQGDSGQYLRYNNPHKLSLYLSSGLPVVIWSGAAEAYFVKKYQVGICIDDLSQLVKVINSISKIDYQRLCENTIRIKQKMLKGEYCTKALQDALLKI